MAARPNAYRTLEYGQRLVTNHVGRLETMLEMINTAISENKTLTPEDVARYRAYQAVGKKQLTQFSKIMDMDIPVYRDSEPRKRGRPSQAELEQLERARSGKRATKQVAARGHKVPEKDAPKRRGRPPKAKAEASIIAAPPKKRGRKPKAFVNSPAINADVMPAPKKRGRPKGSKNKTTLAAIAAELQATVNGHNSDIVEYN